jgi:hypothetical protein
MICSAKLNLERDYIQSKRKTFQYHAIHGYVHLIKAKPIHKRHSHSLVRENVRKDFRDNTGI